jgi:hypothetical protein
MIKVNNVKMIETHDWDRLVLDTYGKPYCFQQQYGCQSRGVFTLTIPSEYTEDEYMNDEIPYKINGSEMGVKFKVWLDTTIEDINREFERVNGKPETYQDQNLLFWYRNFYPDINTVADDLHKKGLIEAGDYVVNIDW